MSRVLLLIFSVVTGAFSQTVHATVALHVEVLAQKQHDPDTFTQGFYLQDDTLYESSGIYGRSFIQRYNESTNKIERSTPLDRRLFAEGLTLFNNELFLLTWKAQTLLVYDQETLQLKRSHKYIGEGWGLTHNQSQLIMSNGSANIHFRNPKTLAIERSIEVHSRWRKYTKINELEYAQGFIWANVWLAPYILKISPQTGKVEGIAALDQIVAENTRSPLREVLNGIAYDSRKDAFWITGKYWSKRYLVKFKAPPSPPQKTRQQP